MPDFALVIQAFIKSDTLDALCRSLLTCENRQKFDLIFWSDVVSDTRHPSEYRVKAAAVDQQLRTFASQYRSDFRSISLRYNTTNRGTCKTCQMALDAAFQEHDFVIFSEDDTVFAPDALNWFLAMYEAPAFSHDEVWTIAGESILFDSKKATPSPVVIERAKHRAVENKLWGKFVALSFVPSTCFATSREKWRQFSATRGQPQGDVDLCNRCKAEGKTSLFPLVARVKDVGMLHPDGYSVAIHSIENVGSVKNCYLMSNEIKPAPGESENLELYEGDIGPLFSQTVLLSDIENSVGPARVPAAKTSEARSHLLEAARSACREADWSIALKLWMILRESEVENSEIKTNISLCLLKCGQRAEAKIIVQEILESSPTEAFAQSIMAYILEADGDVKGAQDIWERMSMRGDLADWLQLSAVKGKLRCLELSA